MPGYLRGWRAEMEDDLSTRGPWWALEDLNL